jgi:hypothetical protein
MEETAMSHRLLVALTAVNLAGLLFTLGVMRPAAADSVPEVLRARSLQIVDDKGRVRASIAVLPASTSAAGERHAETVILRLITELGRPSVKIGSSEMSQAESRSSGRRSVHFGFSTGSVSVTSLATVAPSPTDTLAVPL